MRLSSSGFKEDAVIPEMYSRDGRNASPPLAWDDAPKNTKSFALIVDDPDAPSGKFTHWLVYNIPQTGLSWKKGCPPRKKYRMGCGRVETILARLDMAVHNHRAALTATSSGYALDSDILLPPSAAGRRTLCCAAHYDVRPGQ